MQNRWLSSLQREFLIPGDLFNLGIRMMLLGLRVSLIAYPLSVVFTAFCELSAGGSWVCSTLLGLSVGVMALALYGSLVGKLLCNFAPVGKGWVRAYWLGMVLFFSAFCSGLDILLLWLFVSSSFFPAFLLKLSGHFRWSLTARHLRLTLAGYAVAAMIALLGVAINAAGANDYVCYLSAGLVYYLSLWSYARCLSQASTALQVNAQPVRLWTLLGRIHKNVMSSLKSAKG